MNSHYLKRCLLDIGGAMQWAKVWCNGEYVTGWPYGYASWQASQRIKAFGGLATVIVRRTGKGKIVLSASSEGLRKAKLKIKK